MHWKTHAKQLIPPRILNRTLLALPFLYRTSLVRYESNLVVGGGLDDLMAQLDATLGLPGDIGEFGCSRCGTSVIMGEHLKSKGVNKRVLAFDSFEGFDNAEVRKDRELGLTKAPEDAFQTTSYAYVSKKIERLGLKDRVQPIQGYFQDSLPKTDGEFCFALVDCDLKDSLVYCAEWLWPRLAPGGRIVFDDYTAPRHAGAKVGVDSFVDEYRDKIGEHGLLKRLYYVTKKGT